MKTLAICLLPMVMVEEDDAVRVEQEMSTAAVRRLQNLVKPDACHGIGQSAGYGA